MKKTLYFTSNRGAIELSDNMIPMGVNSSRSAIDYVYLLTEPTHLVYARKGSDKKIELDGEAGDIVVLFYESCFDTPMIVINSKEWADNIRNYDKKQQEAAEKWAAEKAVKEMDLSSDTPC